MVKDNRYESESQAKLEGSAFESDSTTFGGLQLLLCGDFFQLAPIVTTLRAGEENKLECHLDRRMLCRGYAFESTFWYAADIVYHELHTVMRQRGDENYISLLNRIRMGEFTPHDLMVLNKTDILHDHINDSVDERLSQRRRTHSSHPNSPFGEADTMPPTLQLPLSSSIPTSSPSFLPIEPSSMISQSQSSSGFSEVN